LSLGKFFDSISRLIPVRDLTGKVDAISRLDPEKIYVENIRSVLGVSHGEAVRICETATRQGVFDRFVEVLCPDGVVAAEADAESDLPDLVRCWTDDGGQFDEVELPVSKLRKRVYYRLHEQPTTCPKR
jgi:hypothetical protein